MLSCEEGRLVVMMLKVLSIVLDIVSARLNEAKKKSSINSRLTPHSKMTT